MGLQEKRAVKAFQDGAYQTIVNEINTLAGFPLEFEVKWDTLALDDYTALYEECFPKVYFTPLANAIKDIAVDDLGKEALKDTLKKVIIKNEGAIYSASYAYSFADGVLTIDHEPFNNVDNVTERSTVLGELLMKNM